MSELFYNPTDPENPFRSPAFQDGQRSYLSSTFIGFIAGFAPPFVLGIGSGIYISIHEYNYRLAHPLPPNAASCGMAMMGPVLLVAIVAPLFGTVGTLVGAAIGRVARRLPN